jgi:hypothetical protein
MAALCETLRNENGAVAIISLLVLVLITIIGIAATTTTTIETHVAGNNRWQKVAFYAAEGGTETGIELIEVNIEETGFEDNGYGEFEIGDVGGPALTLYMNDVPDPDDLGTPDAVFPRDYLTNEPHTNLNIGGDPGLSTGSAIQMAAGYEGKGKSSAGGGGYVIYDIFSEHLGRGKGVGRVRLQWKHVM